LELYAQENDGFHPELISEASKRGSDAWPGKIDHIVDIEDTLWMPQFGLKGKLDLTSTVRKSDRPYKKLVCFNI
jgi:DNA replication factor Dna2